MVLLLKLPLQIHIHIYDYYSFYKEHFYQRIPTSVQNTQSIINIALGCDPNKKIKTQTRFLKEWTLKPEQHLS